LPLNGCIAEPSDVAGVAERTGLVKRARFQEIIHRILYLKIRGRYSMGILRNIWRVWKRIGRFIGDWIARIVLSVFYFTIFSLFGLGVRLLSDPLTIKKKRAASWLTRETPDFTIDKARRLF
jgi:hypothetical protein